MKMKLNSNTQKQYVLLLLVFLVYALITCGTQFMQADDFYWYYVYEKEALAPFQMPNGRYVSNTLTFLIIRYPLIRWLVFPALLVGLLWLMGRLTARDGADEVRGYWLALALLIQIPIQAYTNVFYYLSAYVIYVLPMVCAFTYLHMCFRVHEEKGKLNMLWRSLAAFAIGIVGALCLESATIYICALGLFYVLWSIFAMKKRGLPMHIAYLVGAVIGTLLMLSNANYGTIANKDQLGARYYEFSLTDILVKLYQDVIPKFAKPMPLVHIVIAVCLYALYMKADRRQWNKSRCRYAAASAVCVVLYATYSLFSQTILNFQETTWAMRVYAVQTALAFLYCVSIFYLTYLLFPRDRLFRIALYLCSAILNSAVFCVVGPISARCFFATHLFWILLCIEIVLFADAERRVLNLQFVKTVSCVVCFAMSYCVCVNKHTSRIQVQHLREQLAKTNVRAYEIITLPYEMFDGGAYVESPYMDSDTGKIKSQYEAEDVPTTIEEIDLYTATTMEIYFRLWAEYYDLEINPSTFRIIEFSLLDYNTESRSTETPTIPDHNTSSDAAQ